MRVPVLIASLLACAPSGPSRPRPAPSANANEPVFAEPGYRLSAATRTDLGLEVPARFVEGRDACDGVFPSPAAALEERWVWGETTTVCRSAFYATDLSELSSAHPTWSELVGSIAGDEMLRESKLARDGLRFHLRRERSCIYHECKPPLSPPLVTLEICDERATRDPLAVARTMMGYLPVLDGHATYLGHARVTIVSYRRDQHRDEVQITLDADHNTQAELRLALVQSGLAVRGMNEWALDSTDKRRSYVFYPPGTSRAFVFSGRSK